MDLDLYDRLTNTFKVFNFPDNDIGAFYKDKSGYIWVGTNTKGLFLCNQDGTILKTYDMLIFCQTTGSMQLLRIIKVISGFPVIWESAG